ncbi:carbohydrate porin [Croceicoccus ponticola]|uniref:Carbohydrate porin n=1 Tax=Croceicoccus ponticola TaxID=2217664 RepID=A0A437GW92_9SPHN|nr:carbohydrate porin [Croceicoccus ponticola]RVQ66359.1 carbohydrate porin [Croceicoccus ponticola]
MTVFTSFLVSAAAIASNHATPDVEDRHDRSQPSNASGAVDPIDFEIVYTVDVMANLSGGAGRGTRYLDNLNLVLVADLEHLAGWRGASASVHAIYNNGASISELVGDAMAVSNIETGTRAFRVLEAWLSQSLGQNASVKVGLYDLNSEFDMLETASVFVGSAHGIGMDIAQTGQNGPSIFPVTSLALRFEAELTPGLRLRVAALDAVPGDLDRPARTSIRLNGEEGALLIGEAEYLIGSAKLLAGHWRYTEDFQDFRGEAGKGNVGYYLRGEAQLLMRDDLRLDGFFRLGTADGRFNAFDRFTSAGIVVSGLRRDDALGLAFAGAWTSDDYRLTGEAQRGEFVVETTYRAVLSDYLTMQPTVQYVINPSADPTLGNALVAGLRFEFSAGF